MMKPTPQNDPIQKAWREAWTYPPAEKPNHLAAWLQDRRVLAYLGKDTDLKLDVLGAFLLGGNMAAVARKHGVTRQAANNHLRKLKAELSTKN